MASEHGFARCGLGRADPMSRDLVLADPGELTAGQFGRLQQIYEESFPSELRVPVAELAAASPRDRMLVALQGGEPVGFAALRMLTGPSWVFLRYYGIAAGRRRSGLGLRFWQLVVPAMTDVGWPAKIALEAEDPADAAADLAEQEIRRARIGFWMRCGAVALPVPGYVMPAFTDTGRAEPMVLMAFDPAASGPSLADVTDLVRAIFIEHYGRASPDPIVSAALDSIPTGNGGTG